MAGHLGEVPWQIPKILRQDSSCSLGAQSLFKGETQEAMITAVQNALQEKQGSGTAGSRGGSGCYAEQKSGEGGFPRGHLKHGPLE